MSKIKFLLLFLILIPFVMGEDAPTSIYGQVLINERPYEGAQVTAHFVNYDGIFSTAKVSTFNEREASLYKSKVFKGYYVFEDLPASQGTNIVISFRETKSKLVIPSSPEKTVKATSLSITFDSLSFDGEINFTVKEDEENDYDEITNLIFQDLNATEQEKVLVDINNNNNLITNQTNNNENIETGKDELITTADTEKESSNNLQDVFYIILFIVAAVIILGLGYAIVKTSSGYISNVTQDITLNPTKASSRKILKSNIKTHIKTATTINIEQTYKEALSLIIREDVPGLCIVRNNEYLGYLSEHDLLFVDDLNKKIENKPGSSIKNDDDIDVALNIMLNNNLNDIAVVKESELNGKITLDDLQALTINLPKNRLMKKEITIRNIMSKKVVKIEKSSNVNQAIELMKKEDTNTIIVVENNKAVGVFSIKDYLKGLFKYESNLSKNHVGSLMSSHVIKLSPDMDIFDANNLIEKKGYKNYPVGFDITIQGIVSRKEILKKIYEILVKHL